MSVNIRTSANHLLCENCQILPIQIRVDQCKQLKGITASVIRAGPDTQAMLPFSRYPPLRTYLRAVRDAVFNVNSRISSGDGTRRLILVMGNPSADLDSFISAITFSYFQNHCTRAKGAVYIPLLNMPKTPSTDLWRLRPEFGVALRLASARSKGADANSDTKAEEKALLEDVLTIRDLLDSELTLSDIKNVFRPDLSESSDAKSLPIILVDHNAPSITIPKIPSSSVLNRLDIVGCIDHHVEEDVVPRDASPRVVTTGVGSCTTLVISHLRKSGIWPKALDDKQTAAVAELCHLALAPILVDTNNLMAGGEKCSDLDRAIVASLEVEMGSTAMMGVKSSWNRDAFYEPIVQAKANSLNMLNAQEMFERDYKSWTEGKIEIGISSLVKPISWLTEHVGGPVKFASDIRQFAAQMQDEQTADGVTFDVFLLLTPGTPKGKEIVMVTFSDLSAKSIEIFKQKSESLGLQDWDGEGNEEANDAFKKQFGQGNFKIWWMTHREKTRKQGAPLVREAVAAIQD